MVFPVGCCWRLLGIELGGCWQGDDSNPGITATYKDTSLIFSTSGSTGVPKGVMYDGVFLAIHGVIVKMMAVGPTSSAAISLLQHAVKFACLQAKGLKLLPDSLPEGRSNSQLLWVRARLSMLSQH